MSAENCTGRPLFCRGNAAEEGREDGGRGWFVGRFIDPALGLRHTPDVEVKWGEHRQGEARVIAGKSAATTLTLLIRGVFVLKFPDLGESIVLKKSGDYVLYVPGVAHVWNAVEDCVVVTVRWPSV